MTKRFSTGDVDHWNILTESGAQAGIAVNVDLVQIDWKPRAADRPLGFVAQGAITPRVERHLDRMHRIHSSVLCQ
jgi:hypothetical protein